MVHNQILKTSIGAIHIWKVENYSARIAAGEKKREIERLEVRLKLIQLGIEQELSYKSTGQPYLENCERTFLSISHSHGVIAIYIGSQSIGVDVECERKSLFEGRNYFVNDREEQLELTQELLQLIWGAKETFYKKLEGQIDDLKNDVTICSYDSVGKTIAIEYQNEVFELYFEMIDELFVVFTVL